MKKYILPLMIIALGVGLLAPSAQALQTVTLTEGTTQFVEISQKDLNVIKVPTAGSLKAYTTSRVLDVKMEGDSIYVNLTDKVNTQPQELFVVAGSGTYLLMLMPKGIPAELIVARTPSETVQDAEVWEKSHDHVTGLKELIKAMYLEIPPMGFSMTKERKDVTNWLGTQRQLVARYTGASMEGEVHVLKNLSDKPIRVTENEFYSRGILAVSVENHDIPPGGSTMIYIAGNTASQRDVDKTTKRYNPLNVLGTGNKGGAAVVTKPLDKGK